MGEEILDILKAFEDPVPQYVLGCLPAIAIIGASPKEKFRQKLVWVVRCLGCPFTGLFYACNVKGDKTELCLYWLSSKFFIDISENKDKKGKEKAVEEAVGEKVSLLSYRPVGMHTMDIDREEYNKKNIEALIEDCVAKASVLERLSSFVSLYYMSVGIIAGISRAAIQKGCVEWPYIPLILSWSIPAVYRRAIGGKLVVKDPNKKLKGIEIPMKKHDDDHSKNDIFNYIMFTLLFSLAIPGITVVLAYLTPPKGFLCRSKYITVISSIWVFNNILACACHLKGEKNVSGNRYIYFWFSFCGVIVAFLLLGLGVLIDVPYLWLLLGESCGISVRCNKV